MNSAKTVNVFRKNIGKVLISVLFKIELHIEKRLISMQQRAFCMWKVKVMDAKVNEAAKADTIKNQSQVQDKQSAKRQQAMALRSKGVNAIKRASIIRRQLTDALDNDRHTTIDSLSATLRSSTCILQRIEKFHNKLSDLRDQSMTDMKFRNAAREGKILMALVFLRQAMKRKLRWEFLIDGTLCRSARPK